MGSMIVLAGQGVNILERMADTPVATPAASSNFPVTNLYQPAVSSALFMFSSATSNQQIVFDLSSVVNGGFENALSSATDWKNVSAGGSNAFARSSASPAPFVGSWDGLATLTASGSSSGNLSGAQNTFTARTGENRTFTVAMQTSVNTITGKAQLKCLETGHWLTSSGGWSTQTTFLTSSATSWTVKSINYTVETQTVALNDTVSLQITLYASASSGTVAFDECRDWPWVDFVSLHGFNNCDPALTVVIHSSTDNFVSGDTTRATMTSPVNPLMNPGFWTSFTQEGDRYLKVLFSGTPAGTPFNTYGSNIIVAQKVNPARLQDYGWKTSWAWAQARSSVRSFSIDDMATRTIDLSFKYPSSSNFSEARDLLFGRSSLGNFPLVVVPYDQDDLVIYGRIDPSWNATRTLPALWEQTTVRVIELPNGNVTNV